MNQLNFTEARDDLDERMVQPEFSAIAATAAQRLTRGRTGVVAGVVATVGVIVASFAVAQVATAPADNLLGANRVCWTQPVSTQVTYLVLRGGECRYGDHLVLARTADAGHTWQTYPVPARPGANRDRLPNVVLDENTVVVGGLLTRDGGQTWRPLRQALDTPVDAVPTGWVVMPVSDYLFSHDQRLAAVDPVSGRIHLLAHQPATSAGGVTQASDGSLWISPRWPREPLAVSHDSGRNWTTFGPPVAKSDPWMWVTSLDGRVGYAVVSDIDGSGQQTAIYRTGDGGQSWQQWSTPQVKALNRLQLLADGTLAGLSSYQGINGAQLVVSKDQGRTFTLPNPSAHFSSLGRPFPGLYVADGVQGTGSPSGTQFSTLLSADGVTYTLLPFPRGVRREDRVLVSSFIVNEPALGSSAGSPSPSPSG
jgi:photosystem II stability/assembly factor-like uncharacterized protein